ncbi:DNA cytosine methyltransferase [Allomesorhizobium alhagi]|nr:DNA cytosine methyltransferase [Mesorhizobium alhagi]
MTIVLFAGLGGGCDGLELAGFPVHVAINHDPVAVAVHKMRHRHTRHLQCDVFEADPREVCGSRGVRVLHASPDCTHFSVAKGGKPVSKRRRSLAWVVCRWAGTVRPETITLENVSEIQTWGGLIAKRDPATGRVLKLDGTIAANGERVPVDEQWLVPDPKKRGRIWRAWLKHMHGLGYSFEGRVIVCSDHGIPTIRKRYFGVAKADGSPIVWPERTHAPRKVFRKLGLKPWVGVHTCIDWSRPVKSIFGRPKDLAMATLRRTARGVMRYVVTASKPFIVPITHSGGYDRVHSIDDPLRTLTTAHRGEMSVVVPHLGVMRNSAKPTYAADEPSHAFTAGGAGHALVATTLIRTDQHSGAARNGVHDIEEPVNTMHTSSSMAVVAAGLSPFTMGVGGRAAQSEPRGMDEPAGSQTTKEDRVLCAVSMVQSGYGERVGQAPRVLDVEEPAGTQVAGGSKAAIVAAFLAQHNNDSRRIGGVNPGRPADEPMSTSTATGSQQAVVAASMLALRGTNAAGRDIAEPAATVMAGGNHAGLILAFLQKYYGSGGQDQAADEPLGALTAKARHGLVTVKVRGLDYVITDIGMRMLEPEEGAAAHGFKPGALPDEIEIDGKRRRLTKTEKYHLVGNSVPPEMVRLLASLNVRPALALEAAE